MEWINLDIFTSLFIVTSMTDALLFLFYQYKHNIDCSPLLAYKKKKINLTLSLSKFAHLCDLIKMDIIIFFFFSQ